MRRAFTPDEAKQFYDRFGAKQDLQAFYENPAVDDLIAHADFGHARAVFEFGFGTGRLAELLLSRHLPRDASYSGIDISTTMVRLAGERLRPWQERSATKVFDGTRGLNFPDQSFDRFVSVYVLDLLTPENIRSVADEAQQDPGPRRPDLSRESDAGDHCMVSCHHPGLGIRLPEKPPAGWRVPSNRTAQVSRHQALADRTS